MDDRGYVAQALFDRLSGDGVAFRILGESEGYPERAPSEVQLAVPRAALDGIPRALGAFCQELDLQLVHLAPEDSRAWRCVLAWSDEVGRPRFMSARICSDYCRGLRCYLRAEELVIGIKQAWAQLAPVRARHLGDRDGDVLREVVSRSIELFFEARDHRRLERD